MFKESLKKNFTKAAIGASLLAPTILGTVTPLMQSVHADSYQADQTVQVTSDGSGQTDGVINLNGAKTTQSIKNKKFMLYKIFNAQNSKNEDSTNYTFNEKYKAVVKEVVFGKLTDEYKQSNHIAQASDVSEYVAIDYIQSLNTHKVKGSKTEQTPESEYSAFRYFIEDLKNAIKTKNIAGDEITVTNPSSTNSIKITGLSWGYYVVDEVSTGDDVSNGQSGTTSDGRGTDGKHFASSLVLVNTVNNEATITLKSDYPEIVKKIQEDDNKDVVGNDGWNDIGDYQIGQTVHYQNDITIPNMNGYHGYYFAIEDRMAKELTLHADKSKMKLVISKGDKSYTLTDADYNLQTIGSNVSATVQEAKFAKNFEDPKTTFGIEIEDLKAIVDREFPEGMNATEHTNDYSGMKLHYEYEATLNDQAAEDTGRPGYENDVRLIFSNDPDSTGSGYNKPNTPPGDQPHGKTPWDTVVAFTYRLNGNKVNTNNFALEGAKFRIYEDSAMTKEIIVKKKTTTTTADKPTAETSNAASGDVNAETGSKAKGTNEYIVVDKDSVTADTQGVDIVSDAEGNFSIVGLDSGKYYIKEVAAPDGYRLLKDPVEITVTAKMSDDRNSYIKGDGATDQTLQKLSGNANLTEFYHQIFKTGSSDLKADADAGTLEMTVVNETMDKLPVTGGQMMAILMAIGAGVVAITIYSVSSKREEADDLAK